MTDAFIAVEDVSYAYPLPGGGAVPALRGVSLRIGPGECVAVVGANGSGKSTLARHLNALLRPDAGRVRVAGLDTRDRDRLREIRRTVGMVFQRPEDQIVATVVAQDVAFGPENLGLPPDVIRARVREALEMLGMWDLRARPPHQLSAGQLQRVALAGVLAMRPRCVVFDEATAMLDPAGRRAVRALMQRLHREGLTVIEITHFMEEALDAQRVIVLDRGRVALDGPPEAVFSDAAALEALGLGLPPVAELAHALRGRVPALPPGLLTAPALVAALDALPRPTRDAPTRDASARDAPARVGPTGGGVDEDGSQGRRLIEVAHLDHVYMQGTPLACRALSDVSLAVAEGVPHGLLGATGSGKSTLMQHLNGLLRPQAGSVRIAGVDLGDPDVDLRAVRRMAGLVFQMPEAQLFEQYVGDEIAYGLKLLGLDRPTIRARVRWAMSLVGLDFEGTKDRLTFALSGGEQRKVALASILALRPRILLLDEPTAGLDPASRREVLAQVQAFQAQGLTLVLSSHRMEDLAQLAERLTVLDGGAVALSGSTPAVFAQGSRLAALGLSRPVAAEVAAALRQRGWPLSKAIVRPAQLIEGVARLLSRATDEAQG